MISNSIKFQNLKSQINSKIFNTALKFLPIEKKYRSTFDNLTIFSIYVIHYLTLFTIITLQNQIISNFSLPSSAFIVLQVFRILFCFLFITTKSPIFLFFQGVSLFISCLFTGTTIILCTVTIFDVISSVIWVICRDQKYQHFDSVIFIQTCLLKQLVLYASCVYWFITKNTFQANQLSCVINLFIGFCLLFLDKNTNYYCSKFKNFTVMLDICCMLSALFPFIYFWLSQTFTFTNHLMLMIVNIWSSITYSVVSQQNFEILFTTNPWQRKMGRFQIIQYFIRLKNIIQKQSQHLMTNFYIHHVRICTKTTCCLKFHQFSGTKDQTKTKQALTVFIKQQLLSLVNKYHILHEFLIYNYFDRAQDLSKYLNQHNFFHMRQHHRFFSSLQNTQKAGNKTPQLSKQQQQQKSKQKSSDYILQFDLIPQIQYFVTNSIKFWKQLLQYNVDATKVIQLGVNQVQSFKKIKKILVNKVLLTQKSKVIVNCCMKYIFKAQEIFFLETDKVQRQLSGFFQANPTIVISAQNQDFLHIIDANNMAVKATGYSKTQLQKLTIDRFWQKQIRQQHIKLAYQRANYKQFSRGQLIKTYGFFANKFGYAVFAYIIVYFLSGLKGKKWYVTLQPYLVGQAVLVFSNQRQLLGFNTNCLIDGIRKSLQGKKLSQKLFKQAIHSKRSIKIKKMKIFENDPFIFQNNHGIAHYLKFQTQIIFNNKPCYFIFTLSKRKQTANSQQSRQDVKQTLRLVQDSKSNGKYVQQCNSISQQNSNKMSNLQPPQFHFSYDINKKLFGSNTSDSPQHLHKKSFHDNDLITLSLHHSQYQQLQPHKYDDEIIQMRLWKNNLDFIQNMQVSNHLFQSYPEYKIQSNQMKSQIIKENFQIRAKLIPKNLFYLRIFFITLFLTVLALTLFVNINGSLNKLYMSNQLSVQRLMFDQLNRFVTLSTTLIGANFDATQNITQKISQKNADIQKSYQQMHNLIPQFQYLMNTPVDGSTLQKSSDMFRLLIQNSLTSATHTNRQHLTYLSQFIYPGWINILQIRLNNTLSQNNKIIKYYIGFIVTFALFLIIFWIYIVKQVFSINQVANQITLIFIGLEHKAIVGQVAKLKSFKNYLDCDDSLIDDQNMDDIRDQPNSEKIHQKRIVNKSKRTNELILIIIVFAFLILYFSIVIKKQYTMQKTSLDHLQIMHNIYTFSLRMSMIWIGANNFPRNYTQLQNYRYNLQAVQRFFQQTFLTGLQANQFTPDMKDYLIAYSVGDACIMIPPNKVCTLTLNGTWIRGSKQNNILYWNDYQNLFVQRQNATDFYVSMQGQQMYLLQLNYYQQIAQEIGKQINIQSKIIIQRQNTASQIIIFALILAVILGIITYICLAARIKEFVELETIITWLDFQVVRKNRKYIQFLTKNKINMR